MDSGAMALDRWNLFRCGVFRYSCALENVNKLEITEVYSTHTYVRDACCRAWQLCWHCMTQRTPHERQSWIPVPHCCTRARDVT